MKEDKLIEYLFPSKKKRKPTSESLEDKQKYDARLLAFLSSDKVMCMHKTNSGEIT